LGEPDYNRPQYNIKLGGIVMVFLHSPVFGLPLLYLDPGSGSFIIQLLLAAALGIGVGIKIYWAKIKSLFTGKKVEPKPSSDEVDEE
jgi:hypothetical protein